MRLAVFCVHISYLTSSTSTSHQQPHKTFHTQIRRSPFAFDFYIFDIPIT